VRFAELRACCASVVSRLSRCIVLAETACTAMHRAGGGVRFGCSVVTGCGKAAQPLQKRGRLARSTGAPRSASTGRPGDQITVLPNLGRRIAHVGPAQAVIARIADFLRCCSAGEVGGRRRFAREIVVRGVPPV